MGQGGHTKWQRAGRGGRATTWCGPWGPPLLPLLAPPVIWDNRSFAILEIDALRARCVKNHFIGVACLDVFTVASIADRCISSSVSW